MELKKIILSFFGITIFSTSFSTSYFSLLQNKKTENVSLNFFKKHNWKLNELWTVENFDKNSIKSFIVNSLGGLELIKKQNKEIKVYLNNPSKEDIASNVAIELDDVFQNYVLTDFTIVIFNKKNEIVDELYVSKDETKIYKIILENINLNENFSFILNENLTSEYLEQDNLFSLFDQLKISTKKIMTRYKISLAKTSNDETPWTRILTGAEKNNSVELKNANLKSNDTIEFARSTINKWLSKLFIEKYNFLKFEDNYELFHLRLSSGYAKNGEPGKEEAEYGNEINTMWGMNPGFKYAWTLITGFSEKYKYFERIFTLPSTPDPYDVKIFFKPVKELN